VRKAKRVALIPQLQLREGNAVIYAQLATFTIHGLTVHTLDLCY